MQNENLNMYQLDYEPERLDDFNDYFIKYTETKDSRYFNEFMHFYEPVLNRRAINFLSKHHLEEYRLPDLKQIFISMLWDELQKYKADSELPLLQIMKYKISKAWLEYIRTDCGVVNMGSENLHRKVRKVAALYFKLKDSKPYDEIVKEISEQLNISEKTVVDYIRATLTFKYSDSISIENYYMFSVNESQYDLTTEDIIFDDFNAEQIRKAAQSLSPIELRLLELTTGISLETLEPTQKLSYNKTALLLGMTESAVEKKRKRVIAEFKRLLEDSFPY